VMLDACKTAKAIFRSLYMLLSAHIIY
jgi:hypothetical protein